MRKPRMQITLGLAVFMMLTAGAAVAADTSKPSLEALVDRYQQIDHYAAEMKLSITVQRGGWVQERSAPVSLVFDRDQQKLLMKLPGAQMQVLDGQLVVVFAGIEKHHLEASMTSPITAEKLLEAVPELAVLFPPQVYLLLGDSNAWGHSADASTEPSALAVSHAGRAYTLTLDSEGLLEFSETQADLSQVFSGPMGLQAMRLDVVHRELAPEDLVFDVDVANSTAHATMLDMQSALLAEMQAAAPNRRSSSGVNKLLDQEAPEIVLDDLDGNRFTLSDHTDEVVVLDFWATWCGPCVFSMPTLQKVHDWVQDNGIAARVIPVNVREDPNRVRQFWTQEKLSMPTVLDTQGVVTDAYQVNAFPTYVLVYRGKVRRVYEGAMPNLDAVLVNDIRALLAE